MVTNCDAEFSYQHPSMQDLHAEVDKLRRENAELRECLKECANRLNLYLTRPRQSEVLARSRKLLSKPEGESE